MTTRNTFSPEVRDRAVRIVEEHRGDYASEWAAISSIAGKIGCSSAHPYLDRVRLRPS